MFKSIFRMLFTIVIIVFIGIAGYLYMLTIDADTPHVREVEIEEINLKSFNYKELNKSRIKNLEEEKLLLAQRINFQEELLQDRKARLEDLLEKEIKILQQEYHSEVEKYGQKISEKISTLEQELIQERKEKVLVQQELYENKMQTAYDMIYEKKIEEFKTAEQKIIKEFYPEKLNISLKLNILDLSEDQIKAYQEKLNRLEIKQKDFVKEEENIIETEIREEVGKIEDKYNSEFIEYQQRLNEEYGQLIAKKRQEFETELDNYINNILLELNQEIYLKEQELNKKHRVDIVILENIIHDLKSEYQELSNKLAVIEKEVRG